MQLQRFSNGDTGYVARHNANADAIEAAVNGLLAQVAAAFGANATVGAAFEALFGAQTAVVGSGAYACAGSGDTLTIQPGWCWLANARAVRSMASATTMSFTGEAAGTWYISADASGTPVRSTSATDALYSVEWTGTAFGAIARVAAITWGAADWQAAQTSSALAQTYPTLDARLEAGEAAILDHLADPTAAHAASAIAVTPTGAITATDAQTALQDLDTRIQALAHPAASATPPSNGDLAIELTSDTTLTIKVKGSDGTIRSVALTLA